MRHVALFLLLASSAAAQSPADTIRRLDSAWARMYVSHDTSFAKQLYADDMIWTSSNGSLKDKRTELGDVAPAAGLVMDYFRTAGVEVRMLGRDGAVVTGVAEWKFTMGGTPREVVRRYTSVYRRGGPLGWSIVAQHMGNPPPR
jgi:ketosteroid isomerase-like protein